MQSRRLAASSSTLAATLFIALAAPACVRDIPGTGPGPDPGTSDPDLGAAVDGGGGGRMPDLAPAWADRDAFCAGGGPVVVVGDNPLANPPACTGQIAGALFQNALCTCEDVLLAGYLKTRAFNSNMGGMPAGGGPVGINGSYAISAGYTDVSGSFSIAGPNSLNLVGYVNVGGDFRLGGTATVPGYTKVGRDAWFRGTYTDLGPIDIGRDLHRGGTVIGVPVHVGGQNAQQSFTIPPPCSCNPKDILDVGKLVDGARTLNDNAAVGLSPKLFENAIGKVSFDLPCGRFYVTSFGGLGDITVNVNGRVALFVDGSISALGVLQFKLAPGAEIDLFVKGNLALTGKMSFGDKSRPAATRIYVGGTSDITLIGASGFVGNLYAPRAAVNGVGDLVASVAVGTLWTAVSPQAAFGFSLAVTAAGTVVIALVLGRLSAGEA